MEKEDNFVEKKYLKGLIALQTLTFEEAQSRRALTLSRLRADEAVYRQQLRQKRDDILLRKLQKTCAEISFRQHQPLCLDRNLTILGIIRLPLLPEMITAGSKYI